jgi:CubicO group peptidase (beta-lactamase class C family)
MIIRRTRRLAIALSLLSIAALSQGKRPRQNLPDYLPKRRRGSGVHRGDDETMAYRGAAVGIVKDGRSLEGFGNRDVTRGLPVTPKTRFILGSTTKAFTTALGLLVSEKKLD